MPPAFSYHVIPTLKDNYTYLLVNEKMGQALVIDPGEAEPILSVLEKLKLKLVGILNTHHHWDHVNGNEALHQATQAPIIALEQEADKIPRVSVYLKDQQSLSIAGFEILPLHVPGHTLGHTTFFIPSNGWAFTGDTLFSLGCGRLFEGTAPMMYQSIQRLAALPKDTLLFPGHEYTAANGRFALAVDRTNHDLQKRLENLPTTRCISPVILEVELATNPFLRCHKEEIATAVGLPGCPAVEVFRELRRMKDEFRS